MHRTVRGLRLSLVLASVLLLAASASAQPGHQKIGPLAQKRVDRGVGWSRVIIEAAESADLSELGSLIHGVGGTAGEDLPIIRSRTAYLPDPAIAALADHPKIARVSLDRVVQAVNERTSATIGAAAVRQELGYDGTGVTIAVIDSGVAPAHEDLGGTTGQRIIRFIDLVKGRTSRYDDHGHGTHVAGILAGNGYASGGARMGIAPGAEIVAIKVLDDRGRGRISRVIAALDYVVANRHALNVRIVNLSISAGVFESYDRDPLTQAAKRAVDAGLVVVAAAGNQGRDATGRVQYGGITAPGNAPWVLTVGASSHQGTIDRADDTIAPFSSRGPTAVNYAAKPDLVAPGVGIESLAHPNSLFYTRYAQYLLPGTIAMSYLPYLSLSGTSMATPVVSGTVALMLQANPALTPNQVKAILQYTASAPSGYDPLTQGAGFLNARGAVDLAQFFAAPTDTYPLSDGWGGRLIWGNRLVSGGTLLPSATAWGAGVLWGDAGAADAVACESSGCVSNNVVWGSLCGGADCTTASTDEDTVVWGSTDDDTVVWGSDAEDTVVWGSNDQDTVVWGSQDDDTVVWGSGCADSSCQPVIWPPQE